MSWELYSAFVAAVVVLIAIPGPNVALIVANSVAYGARHGLVTVAGTASAMVVQLIVAIAGLSGLMAVLAEGFELLRWIGVAYLLYLGFSALRAPVQKVNDAGPGPSDRQAMYLRGFFVSLTNPKTLLFYAAFLPQFVDPAAGPTAQLAILAATFLAVALVLDSGWALLGARARRLLATDGHWLNRVTGGLLISAAVGLAMARSS